MPDASSSSSSSSFTEKVINIPFRHPLAFDNEVNVQGPNDVLPPTGIEGTLVIPAQYTSRQLADDPTLVRPQPRVVVIAHGQSGHRNYIYQKVLAHNLAAKNGLYTFRFDFRNCGNSQNVDSHNGLTTFAEHADLTVVFDYLVNKLGLLPAGIVGHSRGSQACMIWALEQQYLPNGFFIPSIVNCSGRFRTELVFKWYAKSMPDRDLTTGEPFKMSARRFHNYKDKDGKPIEVEPYSASHEPFTIAGYEMTRLQYLRKDSHMLTLHGDNDDIIPVEDSYMFEELLKDQHTLRILHGANHNYVLSDRSTLGGGEAEKKTVVPELVDIITKYLSIEEENKRFRKSAEVIGSTHVKDANGNWTQRPRWQKQIKGVINFRDFGGYPVQEKKGMKRLWIKPGILYRCGKLDGASDADKQAIADLGIKQVYDMRSGSELHPADTNNETGLFEGLPGSGIVTTHVPLFTDAQYNPEALARRFRDYAGNSFDKTYREILDAGVSSGNFKLMLEWIRDHPNTPFLFHCSAGKDRTGIFAMILLLLLGVDKDTIAHEYELTTLGYAPERERVIAASRAGQAVHKWDKKFTGITASGWANLLSSRYEVMVDTINMFEKKYGGARHFLKNVVGLKEEDLERIRSNLLYDGDLVEVQRTYYPSKL